MKQTDYLVLGLGAMGSAALYHLARLGHEVIGLEQFDIGHDLGSSHGHSRAFRIFYREPVYTELAEAALPLWRELEEQSGQSLLHLCGFLAYAKPDNELFETNLSAIKRSRADFEVLGADEVTHRFPTLRIPNDAQACFTPHAGFLDPSLCVKAHLDEASKLGASIESNVRVEKIELESGRHQLHTSDETYCARNLIITAGPWTSDVLSNLEFPLRVSRQQKFYFEADNPESLGPERLPVYADYKTRYYGFPNYGRGIKVADDSRGESAHPDKIDRSNDMDKANDLGDWLRNLMPTSAFEFVGGSTCMYTLTPDEDFIIGPHPQFQDVILGAGFSGHGFKFSTLVGLILAQLAATGKTDLPIERFRPDRYPTNSGIGR